MGLWVEAKKHFGDWVGIIDVTERPNSEMLSADNVYLRAEAFGKLGENALKVGDLQAAAKNYLTGAEAIDEGFVKNPTIGRVHELRRLRATLLESYVFSIDRLITDPDQHIEVWGAALQTFKSSPSATMLIKVGVDRLRSWWSAAERRHKRNANTADTLARQLVQLDWVIKSLEDGGLMNSDLSKYIKDSKNYLSDRLVRYRSQLDLQVAVAQDNRD